MNVLISKRVWKILPFIIMLGLIGVILFGLYHDADIRYALANYMIILWGTLFSLVLSDC